MEKRFLLQSFSFQIIDRLSSSKLVCGKRDCPQRFETQDQLDSHYLHDHHMVSSLTNQEKNNIFLIAIV